LLCLLLCLLLRLLLLLWLRNAARRPKRGHERRSGARRARGVGGLDHRDRRGDERVRAVLQRPALARAPHEGRDAPRVALEQRETLQREQRLAWRPQETGLLQRRAQSASRSQTVCL